MLKETQEKEKKIGKKRGKEEKRQAKKAPW